MALPYATSIEIEAILSVRWKGCSPNGDGLQDDDEYEGIIDTDNDGIINGCDLDSDNDGISDGDEVREYNSSPIDDDCDNDLLLDGEELVYHTMIHSKHSDSDGFSDYYEVMVSKTDPNNPDSDFDGANDNVDFCHEPGVEIMFSIREFIPIDKGDSDGKPDPYMISSVYSSKENITAPKQYDEIEWKSQESIKHYHTSQGVLKPYGNRSVIGFGEFNHHPTNQNKAMFPERYAYDDDFGEKWKHDGTKTRNEMKYKFSLSTDGLKNDVRLVRFIIMIYDDDPNEDDLFDISPVPNRYGEKPNNEKFWENSLFFPNDCVDGKALDVIYDTNTSLWYVMDSSGRVVEGWNYSIDSTGLSIAYDECGTEDGDISWGGYCSGAEDKGDTTGGGLNAAISFDIFPVNKSTYSQYNSSHFFEPGDHDHDKLTETSEFHYYNTNISSNNSDGDSPAFNDWWEIRYDMDPNDKRDYELGLTDMKSNRDNESDGLKYFEEYSYYEWGANPYVKDIFVEVDWMKKSSGKEYKMTEEAQNKVIRPFINNNISLHIDDGCMGGGGAVDFDGSISYPGDWDKYYDNDFKKLPNGNPSNRRGIFHYALMAYSKDGGNSRGQGGCPGYCGHTDMFVLYNSAISSGFASTFSHELGHNILGKIDNSHWKGSSGSDVTHCKNSCTMKTPYYRGRPIGYCSNCWAEITRDGLQGLP